MDLADNSKKELAYINNNELGRIADLAPIHYHLPHPVMVIYTDYMLFHSPPSLILMVNTPMCYCFAQNKNIHVAGDTNSDHHIVTGVLSFIIILISGVAAFVIILLILKIRSQNLILQ